MKIILFGLGSIGKRYARLLLSEFPEHGLFAFRSEKACAPNEFGIREIHHWEEVDEIKPDCAFITNPTFKHIEVATRCAGHGMHLFIEKPVGSDTGGLDDLIGLLKQKGLTAYAAYCLRFHPVIKELKKRLEGVYIRHANVRCTSYLPEWRPGQNHLEGYSAYKEQGGGVMLELSHEFDYIEYLLGRIHNITGHAGRRSDVTVDAEDWTDALIRHEGGHFTNLHLNFFSRQSQRHIEVDTEAGFFRADLIACTLERSDGGGRETLRLPAERDGMFVEQMRYFFGNIQNPSLMNNLEEASHLFRKIIGFRESAVR
ncbi:MAG: Gfo/Idh/MocA family oxidoreductase [Thermodesulfovibrionales bacterium]|nr:Gfo/Idh/MocA family oxidoreductase [Thermodesulfovibrionales bacterium]